MSSKDYSGSLNRIKVSLKNNNNNNAIPKELNCVLKQSSRIFIVIQKISAPNKVKLTMPGIQSKISRHVKEENTSHNEKNNQLTHA